MDVRKIRRVRIEVRVRGGDSRLAEWFRQRKLSELLFDRTILVGEVLHDLATIREDGSHGPAAFVERVGVEIASDVRCARVWTDDKANELLLSRVPIGEFLEMVDSYGRSVGTPKSEGN